MQHKRPAICGPLSNGQNIANAPVPRHAAVSPAIQCSIAYKEGIQMFGIIFSFVASQILYFALHLESSSFPKPLSARDEIAAFEAMKNGDMAARDKLIRHNLRLVAHIVKKYYASSTDQEDLISIGTIGLIKAVSTFNPDKKARLATYACRCIENELLMMLRTKRKSNRETSLYEPIGTDREGNEIRLYDVIESDEEDACMQLALKNDISLLYEKLESVLTDREQLVLKKRYGLYGEKEYTQKEVAASLGISRSYVSRIEKGAIQKLRPCFLPSHF